MAFGFKNIVHEVKKFAARPWYPLVVGFLAAADLLVAVIPTDVFVVSAVLARPRRWIFIALFSALSSALGAIIAASLCSHYGAPLVAHYFPGVLESPAGLYSQKFLNNYGLWALFFFAAGPLPLQPGVLLAGVMNQNPTVIFGSVLVGRIVKYLVVCYASANSPQLLQRWFPATTKEAAPDLVVGSPSALIDPQTLQKGQVTGRPSQKT